MSSKTKNSKSKTDPTNNPLEKITKGLADVPKAAINQLGTIGKILAEALRDKPILAAIVIVLLIAAIVTIVAAGFGAKESYLFFILAMVALIGLLIYLFWAEVKREKEKIRSGNRVRLSIIKETISYERQLTDLQKQNILRALKGACEDTADILKMPLDLVRGNLFGVDETGKMRMLSELTFNMNRKEELTISMPVGYGSTGRCFMSGKPNIAMFRRDWGRDMIEDEELRKVHPDLQWIISVPVLTRSEPIKAFWVLNIDGLKEKRSETELQKALSSLFFWSEAISLFMFVV